MSISIKGWKKVTPTDPMPMGAKRKEEYPRGEHPAHPRIRCCKADAKKKPPLTRPVTASGGTVLLPILKALIFLTG